MGENIPSMMDSFETLKKRMAKKRDRRNRKSKNELDGRLTFKMRYNYKDTIIMVSGYDFQKVKQVMADIKEAM